MHRVKTGSSVQCAHPKDPGCAHTMRALRLGRVHSVVSWAVSQRALAVSQAVSLSRCRVATLLPSPPGHDTKIVSRLNSCSAHCAPCRACYRACRSSMRRIVARCCVVSQRSVVVLYHDTKHRIATHLASQAPRSRRPIVSRAWLAISQPYCMPQHALAQPYCALAPLLCHDTICCIVTKTGKWTVAHPVACNPFFFLFFFFLFQLL